MYFLQVNLGFEVNVYFQPVLFVVAVDVHIDADVVDNIGGDGVVVDAIFVDGVIVYAISQIWSKNLVSNFQEYFNIQVIVSQEKNIYLAQELLTMLF